MIGDLCASVTSAVDPTEVDPDLPAVGLEHLPRRSITLREWGRAADLGSRKLRFEPGHILFGKIRPYFHKVAWSPVSGICSTDVIVLAAAEGLAGYVLAVTSSDDFIANAVATSNGTKMPRADWKVLARYPIAIPPIDVLRAWSERVELLARSASALALQVRSLEAARDTLLPRLVTGLLEVGTLEVDDVFGWTDTA